jgi:hypothetical protein
MDQEQFVAGNSSDLRSDSETLTIYVKNKPVVLNKNKKKQNFPAKKINDFDLKNLISFLLESKKLKSLNLFDNDIINIEPLSQLGELTVLCLYGNKIIVLEPLRNLKKLMSLDISCNDIINIEPLSQLGELTKLFLSNNEITDLKFLENLSSLKDLDLRNNKIKAHGNIHILASLKHLTYLDLSMNYLPLNTRKTLTSCLPLKTNVIHDPQRPVLDVSNALDFILMKEFLMKPTMINVGVNLTYKEFLGILFDAPINEKHEEALIISLLSTNNNIILHMKGIVEFDKDRVVVYSYDSEISKISRNVIFVTSFKNIENIQDFPTDQLEEQLKEKREEKLEGRNFEAASFIFPIPRKEKTKISEGYEMTDYPFYYVREKKEHKSLKQTHQKQGSDQEVGKKVKIQQSE